VAGAAGGEGQVPRAGAHLQVPEPGAAARPGGYFLEFFLFYVRYSTLLHLPSPLRFHCVGGCWDLEPRTIGTTALAVRRSNHSATRTFDTDFWIRLSVKQGLVNPGLEDGSESGVLKKLSLVGLAKPSQLRYS
jgi:hypothetical protein